MLRAFTFLAGALATLTTTACAQTPDPRPNIVVILADDMGFSDLGCYGSEIDTPNLDRLAAEGVRFTQFYNTSRCCPSRASLLTGLYAHQANMGWMTAADMQRPGYGGQLRDDAVTIPEALREAGYGTYMVGKWHLTHTDSLGDGPNGSWPTQRGFDHFYGTLEGAKHYYRPQWLFRDMESIDRDSLPADYFYTDAIASQAAEFIANHDPESPLFLYTAFYAPHFPLHAPAEDVARFRGQYTQGWEATRQQRLARQLEMGIVPEHTVMSSMEDIPAWDSLTDAQQDDMDHRMAIYAAQVHIMDRNVGRILDALETAGRLENTLILFMSDNGGTNNGGALGRGDTDPSGPTNQYTTYGGGWASVSNTPYRLYKKWSHEGGVITPLVAYWPGRTGEPGSLSHMPGHLIDILPTCLEAAGIEHPRQRNGRPAPPPEGISLLSAMAGEPDAEDRFFGFEHEGHHGMRLGQWKLVARSANSGWELYDLSQDRTEMNNLAADRRDIVRELDAQWRQWAQRCYVVPMDESGWSQRVRRSRQANQ